MLTMEENELLCRVEGNAAMPYASKLAPVAPNPSQPLLLATIWL